MTGISSRITHQNLVMVMEKVMAPGEVVVEEVLLLSGKMSVQILLLQRHSIHW